MDFLRRWHLYYTVSAVVLCVVILYMSLLPGNKLPDVGLVQFDKIVHILFYFVLTLNMVKAYKEKSNMLFVVAMMSAFIYGFIIEIIQHVYAIGRIFDVLDIFANAIGCILAYLVSKRYLYS